MNTIEAVKAWVATNKAKATLIGACVLALIVGAVLF
jgi:hypothetical protein